jgi:16S rRNA (adenine1518-N6/adenine1519-N6)-dimethyltransferase
LNTPERPAGFRPRRKLGQHFLKDPVMIQRIIETAKFDPSDTVLEIGPGLGALTFPLAGIVRYVFAVEKDSSLADQLRNKLCGAGIANVKVVNDDILKLGLGDIPEHGTQKMVVIGNIPYNISSPILKTLMRNRHLIMRAILTFQLELARRLTAQPGNRTYGALSVLSQYHARMSPLLVIPAEAFYPRPKVNSMVLEMDFARPHPRRAEHEDTFRKVVKAAFSHRRKILLNALRGFPGSFPVQSILSALKACDIDSRNRAENLSIDDFLCLSAALYLDKPIP